MLRWRCWRCERRSLHALDRFEEAQRGSCLRARGIIFATTGDDYDRIVADTSEVLRLDPNNVDAHALRAYSYQRKGDASRALADVYEVERLGAKSSGQPTMMCQYAAEFVWTRPGTRSPFRVEPGALPRRPFQVARV